MTTTETTAGRVRVPFTATLTSALHHGAGTAGNTSLLRTQRITLPDGARASVPYVSGNSVRHQMRESLAWHAMRVMNIPDGALTKPVVDLLWSGGAITRTGAETRLDLIRSTESLFPALSLLGYSAGSDMVRGALAVNHLHVVCRENAWRLPAELVGSPHASMLVAVFRGEEFGTRHDVSGSAVDRMLTQVDDLLGVAPKTTQMIYDAQVVTAGAVLFGSVDVHASATESQRRVLAVAIDETMPLIDGCRVVKLGAKTAVGYGTAIVDIDLTSLPDVAESRDWWETHLREHRDDITALWAEIVA